MRARGLIFAAVAAAIIMTASLVYRYAARPVEFGPLHVAPPAAQLSVRIGESVAFSATAQGAISYVWTLWGRPVGFTPSFSYVPAPEDAGWQQVTVEIKGPGGRQARRTWDVGVVPPTPPVLEEVTPPPGEIALGSGGSGAFRCRARVPAARPVDRLTFEWTLDDRGVLREEHRADGGISALVLPRTEPGDHRLRLRVTEDGQSASIAEWTIAVAAQEPPPEPAPKVAAPPAPEPPASHLVRALGPRHLEARVGELLVFETRVEPESTKVSYRWTLDRRPRRARIPNRLEYEPTRPGHHRIEVAVSVDNHPIGLDAWMVVVSAPEEAEAGAPPSREVPPATEPPPVAAAEAAPPTVPAEPPETSVPATEPPRAKEPTATAAAEVPPKVAPPSRAAPATANGLGEAEVRAWLEEYARAWSRKDVGALRRMGQVRSAAQAVQLERYFDSVEELRVDVHVLGLRLDGERASVEFERVDTVTDPSGRQQELRLPPVWKEIERTPEGLRFTERGGPG